MPRLHAASLLAVLLLASACSPSLSLGSAPDRTQVIAASGPAPQR